MHETPFVRATHIGQAALAGHLVKRKPHRADLLPVNMPVAGVVVPWGGSRRAGFLHKELVVEYVRCVGVRGERVFVCARARVRVRVRACAPACAHVYAPPTHAPERERIARAARSPMPEFNTHLLAASWRCHRNYRCGLVLRLSKG